LCVCVYPALAFRASVTLAPPRAAGNYLKACTDLGMKDHDSFQTVALYENKVCMDVDKCI